MDSTKVREEVEERLRIEEESVAWLTEKIKQSSDLTSTMTNVLNSFEERLTKLEATILPVYQETENLQRRQENIDKTLEALDHVIDFYNVSKEVENVVKAGPSAANNLEEFLQVRFFCSCLLGHPGDHRVIHFSRIPAGNVRPPKSTWPQN